MNELNYGDKIYYTGDNANKSGEGMIVKMRKTRYTEWKLALNDGREFWIDDSQVSNSYNPNSYLYRFVTMDAVNEFLQSA
jgi:hypothetical protein